MKFTKMSLVAALLIGSSAFAIENVKVSGDAKLFYSTQDSEYSKDETTAPVSYNKNERAALFDQSTSTGEAALSLSVSADLTSGISAGTTLNAITTLGLYNNLVSSTWTGGVEDTFWFSEAWLAGTAGKTTAKAGRMQLDTPLVFSETWSVAPNTFEAAVVINQDIPDTTLVGAYVGQHNSSSVLGGGLDAKQLKRNAAGAVVVDGNGDDVYESTGDAKNNTFESFYKGAYAVGAINNSFKPLTAQAWYFDATQTVKAYWLQADLEMSGLSFGAQYTSQEAQATGADTQSAYALKVGYAMEDTFAVSAAFSQVDDKQGMANVGANYAGSQSKLYTEAWWYYGMVSKPDTQSFNVTATTALAGIDLGLYYTQATTNKGFSATKDSDFAEATFEVAKSFGPLDAGLYYIYTKSDLDNQKSATETGDAYNTVQVYLTYNF